MPPVFFFAVGARPCPNDLASARLVGQRHFLVPAGSRAATLLRTMPDVTVALDSWAYPPDTPARPSVAAYAQSIAAWYRGTPPCAEFAWAVSYDTIGDAARSAADTARLEHLLQEIGVAGDDLPVVPVTHYPDGNVDAIIGTIRANMACLDDVELAQLAHIQALDGWDPGPVDRPAWAIGGLVIARYAAQAERWYTDLLQELDAAETDGISSFQRRIHLLGIGKPTWVLRSPLVMSFDSSGPARMAQIGFDRGIGKNYTNAYGLSVAKLRRSRAARLAYHLCDYRARVGLPWQEVRDDQVDDDRLRSARGSTGGWEQPVLDL
jgi:hypothetical protein